MGYILLAGGYIPWLKGNNGIFALLVFLMYASTEARQMFCLSTSDTKEEKRTRSTTTAVILLSLPHGRAAHGRLINASTAPVYCCSSPLTAAHSHRSRSRPLTTLHSCNGHLPPLTSSLELQGIIRIDPLLSLLPSLTNWRSSVTSSFGGSFVGT